MKKQPLFVAFTNQKGGVGKSTITILMASYFHYSLCRRVLVVDCDFPQHSISKMRERDKQSVMKNDTYKRMMMAQFGKTEKKVYPIINARPDHARAVAQDFLDHSGSEFDLVLFDLPGTVNSAGVLGTIFNVDYIFVPIIPNRMVMHSSMAFVAALTDYKAQHPEVPLKDIFMFWNRVDPKASVEILDVYKQVIADLNLNVAATVLPRASRFDKELSASGDKFFFLSTMFPPARLMLNGSNLELLAEEMAQSINL